MLNELQALHYSFIAQMKLEPSLLPAVSCEAVGIIKENGAGASNCDLHTAKFVIITLSCKFPFRRNIGLCLGHSQGRAIKKSSQQCMSCARRFAPGQRVAATAHWDDGTWQQWTVTSESKLVCVLTIQPCCSCSSAPELCRKPTICCILI